MKYLNQLFLLTLFLFCSSVESQVRTILPFNDDWKFSFVYTSSKDYKDKIVNLPHTWNVKDLAFERTSAVYRKEFHAEQNWSEKRVFVYFEGVNTVANVFVNKKYIGEHKGGYTAFVFEITDMLKYGDTNSINVMASNSYRLDVLPLNGDFNVFGGIHRPVKLIITDKNCISPLDFGSSGVYIATQEVSEKNATIKVKTLISAKQKSEKLRLKAVLKENNGKIIEQQLSKVSDSVVFHHFSVAKPHLWNAIKDPYLYKMDIQLLDGDKVIDQVSENFGLRSFHVDADKGFFLNGKYYDLYGMGYHEDTFEHASAYLPEDYETDERLFTEIGMTALRLTHYPHGKPIYEWADKYGMVLWTEIPLIGFGGNVGEGYVNSPELNKHIEQMLLEMVRQNYNHPSVFFWGLKNELTVNFDNSNAFLVKMNGIVKKEDPTRKTVLATHLDTGAFENSTDLVAWNKYFGWYEGEPDNIGKWMDKKHTQIPNRPISLSEYGAGASINSHSIDLKKPITTAKFHPEGWQTYFHEKHWKQLVERPYIWGKFIWVFSDFSSHVRNEGDTPGINDKGLVTYDKKTRKDAFYFYKANWNAAPMVYITERRFVERSEKVTAIKVFSNCDKVELYINTTKIGTKYPDKFKTVVWESVGLVSGKNKIKVVAFKGKERYEDTCVWSLK
ncbi:glycoside hydrolase family 2 protein [Flavobacterium sp. XS2P39]|uniref:glycoside hydrolase family 2 protein n=1 Tax=Flavobacterium sp. XS2P39 TaxID=3401725 RepID=UPI003AAD1BAE